MTFYRESRSRQSRPSCAVIGCYKKRPGGVILERLARAYKGVALESDITRRPQK